MPLSDQQVGTRREAPQDVKPGETVHGVAVDMRAVRNRFGSSRVLSLLVDAGTGEVRDIFQKAALVRLFDAVRPGDFLRLERLPDDGTPAAGAWGALRRDERSRDDAGDRRDPAKFRFLLWQVREEPPPEWASPDMVRAALTAAGLSAPVPPADAPKAPKGTRTN